MNAKERFYSGLAKETIGKITSNTDNWTSFLRTMSRNYEFTYPEQVMIYAQRPNATFCKPYEDWNAENYRRYVKRGSTGIALFVMNRDKPYLRYVFDVADTGVRRSSPELKPWEVTPENRSYVMEAMERIEAFSKERNDEYVGRAEEYKAAKSALLEGLGLEHLFDHSHELTPKEKEIWMLFDRVDVAELLARDAFAKGAYMLGAEDREIMLK